MLACLAGRETCGFLTHLPGAVARKSVCNPVHILDYWEDIWPAFLECHRDIVGGLLYRAVIDTEWKPGGKRCQ